jgi:predicted small secreted protein
MRRPSMKMMLIMLATVFALAACNTMQGLGKDVERTGEKIQEKAKK